MNTSNRRGYNRSGDRGQFNCSEGIAIENRTRRLRIRAAWMYYIEQMTQNDIAEKLGVGRVTVVRLLADARARNEIKITIDSALSDITALEIALETSFGLERAIVTPVSAIDTNPVPAISAATGAFLSETIQHGMRIGVGWGETLYSTLQHIGARTLNDLKVISLLGGIVQPRRYNPPEFAWQFAQIFQSEGYLLPAPVLVNSKETREALINHCGLDMVLEMAQNLDMALLSVGSIDTIDEVSYRGSLIDMRQKQALIDRGAVGDLLFHFFDIDGNIIDDPIHERVMSVPIKSIQNTPQRVLTSGGKNKIPALMGAMRLIKPTIFITDEESAIQLLKNVKI